MKRIAGFSTLAAVAMVLSIGLSSCGSDDNDPNPGGGANVVGTYNGNIQASTDPHTSVGYIYNAKVTVSTSGSNATVKVTGDHGFDREFTGTVTSGAAGVYDITTNNQTKPTTKNVNCRTIISDGKLTIDLSLLSDEVTVKDNPGAAGTFKLSGKLRLIGTQMLKE